MSGCPSGFTSITGSTNDMDTKLITSLIELGIPGVSLGILAVLFWYTLQNHRKERDEFRKDQKEIIKDAKEERKESTQVLKELTAVIRDINRR